MFPEFGCGAYWGIKFIVGAKIFSMTLFTEIEPYAGLKVHGAIGLCIFIVCGKLQLEGMIMELRFPCGAELSFNKFPIDVG